MNCMSGAARGTRNRGAVFARRKSGSGRAPSTASRSSPGSKPPAFATGHGFAALSS
jgi:hypothetical protein